jgi:hypothetical protein
LLRFGSLDIFSYICKTIKIMGYSDKYDTMYDDVTGEWLEKIGFCSDEDKCEYCKAYNEDGRPNTVFDAPEDAR